MRSVAGSTAAKPLNCLPTVMAGGVWPQPVMTVPLQVAPLMTETVLSSVLTV